MKIRAKMARKGDIPENVSKMQRDLFEATHMMALPIEKVANSLPSQWIKSWNTHS